AATMAAALPGQDDGKSPLGQARARDGPANPAPYQSVPLQLDSGNGRPAHRRAVRVRGTFLLRYGWPATLAQGPRHDGRRLVRHDEHALGFRQKSPSDP